MSKISLVVITDGRQACIESTIDRFEHLMDYVFYDKIIINDSGDPKYDLFLKRRFPSFRVISHKHRRGLAGAVQSAWATVSATEADFVFHLEDDFLLERPVDLEHIADLLNANPYLVQIALMRAPVNQAEQEVGGFVFQQLDSYVQKDGWFEHTRYFTLNPSLYPMSTVLVGWDDHFGETEFASKIYSKDNNIKFAFYGNIYDERLVTHIGGRRTEGWFL